MRQRKRKRGGFQRRSGGGRRVRTREVIADEISVAILSNVLVHGIYMRLITQETKFLVESIVWAFREENR